MRLTAFTDFGLRALMRLAAEPDRHLSTEVLASELRISRNHLLKVVQALAEAGFVRTLRGARGGVALAMPAEAIRLGQVVRYLEREQTIVECFRPDGGGCNLLPNCRLRGALYGAREAFLAYLDQLTLAECAIGPQQLGAASPYPGTTASALPTGTVLD